MSRLIPARALLTVSMMAAPATPALAQTTGELFDARVLHDLRLFVNSRDLEQLRETYLENTYYQADIEWRGERVRSIGIRSRGTGSRNPVKLGLKIDFDRYVSGQRFRGLKELVLDNLWQDPSLLRESLTMALFTRMGQPAPREAYARLFINDVYEGVYAMVEPLDSVFLSRTYGHDRGYLFEYQWLKPFRGEYLGRSLDPYKERFEAENHESQGDSILYSPIHDLFREVNRPQGPNWRAAVDRLLDVRQFLTHVAVEAFVSELDGILGFWAMNNFYLYRPDDATRHQLIVWDRDNAFQEIASSVLLRADDNRLFQRLTAYGDLHAFYVQMVEACARAAAEGGWLENEIAARASLIIDAAHQDTRKSFTNEEFDAQIAFLRTFARQRPAVVLAEVERLRHARSSRAAAAIE